VTELELEITGLASSNGPLTKRISLSSESTLISDGSACVMGAGVATRLRFDGIRAFADLIGRLDQNEAIALGALRWDLADVVHVTTAKKLAEFNGHAPPDMIARTASHILYKNDQPALALIEPVTSGA
jgi:hypothetical protein